jgi:NAD(P)-dependent dehydrogenase (short-subunit alcohol dehydrogenase family)
LAFGEWWEDLGSNRVEQSQSALQRMARHGGDGQRIRSRPVRTKCVELGVSPTFHSVTKGFGTRVSRSNAGYNQIGHFGEPEEIGESVEWLCSERASFVTGFLFPVEVRVRA